MGLLLEDGHLSVSGKRRQTCKLLHEGGTNESHLEVMLLADGFVLGKRGGKNLAGRVEMVFKRVEHEVTLYRVGLSFKKATKRLNRCQTIRRKRVFPGQGPVGFAR